MRIVKSENDAFILSKHIALNLMSMNDYHQNMRLVCTKISFG